MDKSAGAAVVKEQNLQDRFERLESSIKEAHSIVSQMAPREDDKAPEEDHAATATATAVECQSSIQDLIGRLQNLRDRVGLV